MAVERRRGPPRAQGARVRIGAYALEGLLKQRAARKAATRIGESPGAVRPA
jgi:hypothetical protein